METLYDETGKPFALEPQLASGGQGAIFRLKHDSTHCAKVYHTKPDSSQAAKLRLLRINGPALTETAALPVSLAFTDPRQATLVGAFLPFVGGQEIFELYGTRSRLQHFSTAKFSFLAHTACNLALAFQEIHARGMIVGDINEQNLKVLPDATIRFIDCDSFQISDGAKIYTSEVGTPIWTPPELQGRNLTGLARTTNHDAFGLAQLVFLLLFTGRHPFSGRPRGAKHLQPDEAIREYAFAFAPEALGLPLAPPPGCAALSSLPPDIQEMFCRAFLRGAEQPGKRPSAKDWVEALQRLLPSLVTCGKHSQHVFWGGAATCPWCEVLQNTGIDIFPAPMARVTVTTTADARDQHYLTRLSSLRAHSFAVQAPPDLNDLPAQPLPPEPTGFWSWLHQSIDRNGWKQAWLGPSLQQFRNVQVASEATLQQALSEQRAAIAVYHRDFSLLANELKPVVQQLTHPLQVRREIEIKITGERQTLELTEFLGRQFLRQATIPDIGAGRKTALASYGIETAADISSITLAKVKGFGPTLRSRLTEWRRSKEARFQFDPHKPPSPYLREEAERRFQARIKELKETTAKIETKIQVIQRSCSEKLRSAHARAVQSARQRDQARADIACFEARLQA